MCCLQVICNDKRTRLEAVLLISLSHSISNTWLSRLDYFRSDPRAPICNEHWFEQILVLALFIVLVHLVVIAVILAYRNRLYVFYKIQLPSTTVFLNHGLASAPSIPRFIVNYIFYKHNQLNNYSSEQICQHSICIGYTSSYTLPSRYSDVSSAIHVNIID